MMYYCDLCRIIVISDNVNSHDIPLVQLCLLIHGKPLEKWLELTISLKLDKDHPKSEINFSRTE